MKYTVQVLSSFGDWERHYTTDTPAQAFAMLITEDDGAKEAPRRIVSAPSRTVIAYGRYVKLADQEKPEEPKPDNRKYIVRPSASVGYDDKPRAIARAKESAKLSGVSFTVFRATAVCEVKHRDEYEETAL